MYSLTSSLHYYLYNEPADMRKGFDGLSGIVQNELQSNPHSGDVFVFINKRRDSIKLLHWETDGFILYYKRLEKGTFELPLKKEGSASDKLHWPQLLMMLQGISFKDVKQRKRFSFA